MEKKSTKKNDSGLMMYYQPIQNVTFGKAIGYEALIRLVDKEFHFISPGVFIPIAEKNGLDTALSTWILEEICKTAKKMMEKEIPFEYISMNVSVKHFKKKDYIPQLVSVLEEIGVPAEKLCLEIPEDAFDKTSATIINKMNLLKESGFTLAIDNYSAAGVSLNKLTSIPADIVKLDKALTDRMLIEENAIEKVEDIISTAESAGMEVVANAVEDKNQQVKLAELGCEKMQGFLFGKPVKEREIIYPKTAKK